MSRETHKKELIEACEAGPGDDHEQYATRIKALIEGLCSHNPTPAPLTAPEFDGRWCEAYSSLGVRYARGKALKGGDFNLGQLSFGKLPKVPVQVEGVFQEVDRGSAAYNNVVEFVHEDSGTQGRVIMYGRFTQGDDNPLRAAVDFYAVEASPHEGADAHRFREELGLVQPDRHELKPPKLHSDVVYLDEDTRVNFGSVGGIYVLRQTAEAPVSLET